MALDIKGFVTPEQGFEGLYKIGEALQKKETESSKAAATNRKLLQQSLKFTTNPKDYYTGTNADPQINQILFDAAQAGYDFIDENPSAQPNQLSAYMNPYMQKLVDYSWRAKTANKAIQDAQKSLDPKYYDVSKFGDLATKMYFTNDDGTPKDVSSIQIGNPISDVLGNHPEVVRSTAFDEWVKGQPMVTVDTEKEFGSRPGTVTKKQVRVTAPSYGILQVGEKGQPIVDETGRGKVIPRYDVAMDGYDKITHNGEDVKLLTNEDFNSIISHHPSMIDFVNAQLKQHLPEYRDEQGNPIQLGTPKADLVAKNILWEELNRRGAGSYQIKDYKVTSTRAPKTSGGSTTATTKPKVQDVFTKIEEYFNDPKTKVIKKAGVEVGSPINELEGDPQKALVNLANSTRKKKKFDAANMYLAKDENGQLVLKDFKTDELILPLDYTSVNNALKQIGAPEKREVVAEGEKKQSVISKAVQKGKDVLNKFVPKSKPKEKDPLGLGL